MARRHFHQHWFRMATMVALIGATTLSPTGSIAQASGGDLTFYLSAPGVQGTFVPSVTIENFNGKTANTSLSSTVNPALAVGTITDGEVYIVAAEPEGASSESTTEVPFGTAGFTVYARVQANKSMTVTLTSAVNYLGFWWAAGDAGSTVEIYDGTTKVGQFSTSDITSLIPREGTITANGGAIYTNNFYYGARGRPTPNYATENPEPHAFVHAVAPSGSTFNKIKFIQGSSGGFEFDNLLVGNYVAPFDSTGLVGFGLANDIAADDSFTVTVGETLSTSVAGNDTKLDRSTYSRDTTPLLGTATVTSSGGLTFVAGETPGTTTFVYKLCRDVSTCVTATVTITINGRPAPPASAETVPENTVVAPPTEPATATEEAGTSMKQKELPNTGSPIQAHLIASSVTTLLGLLILARRRATRAIKHTVQ